MRRTPSCLAIFFALAVSLAACRPAASPQPGTPANPNAPADAGISSNIRITGEISDTDPKLEGRIQIKGVGDFTFDPGQVRTVRKDVFREGHFSLFDILVYLGKTGQIKLQYHFDATMDTNVIDSVNGEKTWWYTACYDGGSPEPNTWRMDLYPYKDKTQCIVAQEDQAAIQARYGVFRDEVSRKEKAGGKVVIPEVVVQGKSKTMTFRDVEVKPHNVRNDCFQDGVVTAADVILTLADRKEISCELRWYESIGAAGIVKTYYVDRINEDATHDRTGFIYEMGSTKDRKGNLLHIPADTRVLTCPEYMRWSYRSL